ncbi:MAG: ribosome maturation factor RimM [Gammaproteobacteria bacterium]|nr:ribosome maturation factor RimM [Gammaproteobacteria bacterium]
MAQQEYVVIGAIIGVYGIKGWVKVRSWTRPAENIVDYQPWLLTRKVVGHAGDSGSSNADFRSEDLYPVTLQQQRSHGDRFMVKLDGTEQREQAQALVGRQIVVARSQLPTANDNEYYWSDLIGLAVENLAGVKLGKVTGLLETGANDVLVVQGERERLLPYLMEQVVQRIDLEQGTMLVDWDEDF